MGKKTDEYREALEESEQLATTTTDPVMKQSYKEMADKWRQLLEQAKQHDW
jgi:hypothetical protein